MSKETSKRLQTYELTLRDLQENDIGKLHQLSVGVGWPHRPDDWRMLLKVGKGFAGCDKIGRVVGSAMWFPMGNDFATIGMVITTPQLQAQGGGGWLMDHVMEQCRGRRLQIIAPRVAYRLANTRGFKVVGVVHQHQGTANDPGEISLPSDCLIRPLKAMDIADIARLDLAAFGADRAAILDELVECSTGLVLEREGRIAGFSLCRRFGRGHIVGPVVAKDSDDAIALTAPHVTKHAGRFLRVDTTQPEGGFTEFLRRCGMQEYDQVSVMTLPTTTAPVDTEIHTFALVNQSLG
ncbi:GNAT family N-acetyltransferase [Halomonas sp. ML-15]|uniref:GNAT family N-acetyltransferase n=1 Tax=Halomonas sp. ML-15 TaxID=2773305 RepID=UPI0017460DB6|nr:GNAT family N-acetyltransferase [Halomonas sp. ML-15]MBD3897754.1 GNAT family N-acetyltransferase [Halomonas sp. ML-15]